MEELIIECMRAEAQDDYVRTLGNDCDAGSVKATIEYVYKKLGISMPEFTLSDISERLSDTLSPEEHEEILEYWENQGWCAG